MIRPRHLCLAAAALTFLQLAAPPCARADVRLPKIFGDHMVLQRDKPINVWGWAEPGEDVKVTLGAASASTKAGEDGQPPFPRPPVRPNDCLRGLPPKANS